MRLCFLANPNTVHTDRWLRYFAERGHDVHLVAYARPARSIPDGVELHDLTARVNLRKLRFVVWAWLVRRLVRRLRPDVVHGLQVAAGGWLGLAAGHHPFVVSAWGSDLLLGPRRSRVQRMLARRVLSRADHVLCVSETLAQAARDLGAAPARVEVAPMGVYTDVFYPAQPDEIQALRRKLGLEPGPVVLSIRAMRPVYNPLDIAAAIPRVLEQVPDAQFVIRTYGQHAGLLERFQAVVSAAGQERATAAVHYVGEQTDDRAIGELNRAADVAISVPSSDGTPVSVLEALACGVVPVLSDVPSLREWVQDGQEGLFVPVGDVQALTAAVTRLLIDTPLRRQMSTNAVELIRQRADSRVWMARAEALYEALCNSTSPS